MGSFLAEVNRRIDGIAIQNCYQCQKCTSGCPMAGAMEYKPNQIVRMVQAGLRERLLASSAIWVCASCETCLTRCPNDIDIPRLIDILREMSLAAGAVADDQKMPKFHQAFLGTVKLSGRVNEPLMIATYKFKTGTYLNDVLVGLKMFFKGKLKILSPRTRNRDAIRRIFRASEK